MRARLTRSRNDAQLRTELNRFRRAIREAIADLEREQAEVRARQLQRGPRGPTGRTDFWPLVRSYFSPAPPPLPPLERSDGTSPPASDPADRASVFADHLGTALGGVDSATFDATFRDEVETLVGGDSELRPLPRIPSAPEATRGPPEQVDPTGRVSPWTVQRAISRLRRGKAPGPDGTSSDMLKAAPLAVSEVLAEIFSASLALGWVPARWRHSLVRMLPKSGRALTRPADFRPISLTSTVGKLLEGIFSERLYGYASRRSLLPEEQSAFRPGRGAVEQVTLLAQRAGQALNAGLATTVVSLDMAKAYDTVWHAGLLHQCRNRLPAPAARWIAAFLRQRQAAILEDGALSAAFPLRTGVPQGSPLSPLLYILFTAELPLPRGELRGATAYADDVALWCSAATPIEGWRRLQPELRAIAVWCDRWRLRISPEKTQLAFFSRQHPLPADYTPPVQFLGEPLAWKVTIDLLGVRLDRQLHLQSHAERLVSRAAPRTLALRRLMSSSRRTPIWIGVLLYKTCIRSILTYAAPVLLLVSHTAGLVLERAERRGLRAATRSRMALPIPELHARARVRPLREELRNQAANFLLGLVRTENSRVLNAFVPERQQHAERVRSALPLERAYASLQPEDRVPLCEWIRGNISSPPAPGRSRPSRARDRPPETWGRSPFADAFPPGGRRGRSLDGRLWPWTPPAWTSA